MTKKQLYSRLVSSLVEMSVRQRKRRGRGPSRRERQRQRQAAAQAQAQQDNKPTNPADVGPQNRPPSPTNPPETPSPTGVETPSPAAAVDPEKETKTPDKTGVLQRAVDRVGHEKSIAGRLARRYAKNLPDTSDGAEKVRNFSRGVTKIGAGTASLIKKGLNKGKNVPLGGKSLV